MLNKSHHIAIICSDHRRSMEFYVNKLGFQVVREIWRKDRQDYLTMLRSGDVTLELFTKTDAPKRVTDPEALGLRHLAFCVEDVEREVKWLEGMGIEVEPIRDDPINGGRMTFFRDPDGLPLELHE